MSTRKNAIVEYLDYQSVRVGVANFFWINRCIDETNTFQLKFFIQRDQYISVKIFYLATLTPTNRPNL